MSAAPTTTAMTPAPSAFSRLFAAACGANAGDQLALAALPLTAVLVLGADAATVGVLVAAQGAAWLVGSLPAGLLVDRLSRRTVLAGSQALATVGFALATAMALAGSVPLLGFAAFVAALGTVAFALGVNAMVPDLVGRTGLSRANGRIEVARALVTLAAPVAVGAMARHATPTLAYAAATCTAALACVAALGLPRTAPPPARDRALGAEIAEGFRFLAQSPVLRPIALCALLWNAAFFAFVAVYVPFTLARVTSDPALVGLGQAGYGAGLILGAATAATILHRVGVAPVLLGGPALSVAAPLALLAAAHGGGVPALFFGQFMVGFGPMLWFVCQTSIRQIVTPPQLLGRVGATLQLAIYGVRPFGALAGGWIALRYGADVALIGVAGLFAAAFVAIALSRLAGLRSLADLPSPAPQT